MRDQTRYGGEGPVRGRGALAGSYSGVDHHAHRQEVFGSYREEVEENGLQRKTGNEDSKIPKDRVRAIYRALQREDTSQRSVAEEYDVSKYTVHNIAQGNGRFGPIVGEFHVTDERGVPRVGRGLSDRQVRAIYRAVHQEGREHTDIADEFGVCRATVSYIANAKGRYAEIVGPDERSTTQRMSDALRKYDPEQVRRAYRLAHADNGMTYREIADEVGFEGKSLVGRIKREKAHQHLTEDIDLD